MQYTLYSKPIHTPISGVWELGEFEQSFDKNDEYTKVFEDAAFNKLKLPIWEERHTDTSNQGLNHHYGLCYWHVDYSFNNGEIPHLISHKSQDMLMMLIGERGTWFKLPWYGIWESKPYKIYYLSYYVIHSAPPTKKKRHLLRYDIKRGAINNLLQGSLYEKR